jgi:hypothetical protein
MSGAQRTPPMVKSTIPTVTSAWASRLPAVVVVAVILVAVVLVTVVSFQLQIRRHETKFHALGTAEE